MNSKRKGSSRTKLIAIIVMLVLCAAAAVYIVKIAKHRAEPEPVPDETTATEPAAQDAAADEELKARLAHVYMNSGDSSQEKYTAAAFDGAVGAGAACLAMPIVISADGTPYIANDDNLYDMTGVNAYVSGMVDSQIADMKTKGGNDILSLGDVFDRYGNSVSYVIEIKYTDYRNISAFTETVKKYGLEANVSVSSRYYAALGDVEAEFPDMPKIFLCDNAEDLAASQNIDCIDTVSVEKTLMTEDGLAAVHGSGKKFGAWTLNSEEDIKAALAMGADSYFTDEGTLAAELERTAQ